ncbi:MAG TPA: hypothetical protein VK444_03535 [Methanobacteriaceae archaeon]|nr:hypothetical protein [Methanobacteriaceae archaeon]
MTSTKINRFLEILRWTGVAIAIFFGFYLGTNPQSQFSIFAIITVLFVGGITTLEIFTLAKSGSDVSGYGKGGAYQRQSGVHFLAITLTMILAWFMGWGFYAYASIFMVLLIFLTLSAVNHLYSGLKEKFVLNTILRPLLTLFLWIISLYFLLPALAV